MMNNCEIKIDENKLDEYVVAAKDACFYTGLAYFCSNDKNDEKFDDATFTSFTLLPSPFPRKQYEYAINAQVHWNEVLHYASNNKEFLNECFKEVIKYDKFIEKIWYLYETVYNEDVAQPYTLAINRCDYMIDKNKMENKCDVYLSQIEMNTYGCGGCAIPTKLNALNKYMLQLTQNHEYLDKLVDNQCMNVIVKALVKAWLLYSNPNAHIVLLIRNKKQNYSDHRLLEYELMSILPKMKFKRVTLTDVYKKGRMDEDKRLFIDNDEIALVYYKSGFDPTDYPTENEWDARLMIERSRAIKAPNVQYHLCCTKMFQQYLSEPGVMERLTNKPDVIQILKKTFVKQYSYRKDPQLFKKVIREDCDKYVLKPQREGGGNNIYGQDIKEFVSKLNDESELTPYILMERISHSAHENYLVRPKRKVVKQNVLTELGVFGVLIGNTKNEIVLNETAGYSNLAKSVESNEAGIIAGYGGYNTIFLTD